MYYRVTVLNKEVWTKNKELHRNNFKPAVKEHTGFPLIDVFYDQYWINGVQWKLKEDYIYLNLKHCIEVRLYKNGDKEWFLDNNLGRPFDFPSRIYANGVKEWWHKGKLHRDGDLPAIEYPNGDKEYWIYGQKHRKCGPAVIIGNKHYYYEWGEFQKCIV